ncbi:hypothetical protein GEV33_001976 [Tenebrio molitor]|uniref:Uncharacterized protein n=1 Tax=Tenebrio molitor TaxID=7067 RepID=A0A8J6HU68_TENMO|nr:hypothetical protein GEV33_001976 [Tenebrio molitor]
MREGSRTFQNGLSDPDFRCRPRQICERRGEDIKVEQTPCAGEPVEEDRSGLEIVQEELQPYVAADIGFLHEGSHQRTGPHSGLSLAEEPESRSNSYLARKGRGEEGPRGLSEDTDGVIDQRRKRDSEDLPPAHSSRDSLWIPSLRPGDDLECKRRASLEVSLQFASFFQYDVYYKVVSCASNPKERIEDRNEVDAGYWANKMQELCYVFTIST